MLWQRAAASLAEFISPAEDALQTRLGQHPAPGAAQIRLPVQNVKNWLFTTSVGLGTPPQSFTAAIDVGWSDMFVPSVACLSRPSSSCSVNSRFNASASSTCRFLDRIGASLHHFGFYTSGPAAQDSLHLGRTTVPGQVFLDTDDVRPTYVFDGSWYDAPLGLARRIVVSDESDLRARSPFQNLLERHALQQNLFVLKLPPTPAETGELVIGAVDNDVYCRDCQVAELPLRTQSSTLNELQYTQHRSMSHTQQTYFLSGGWEVQPLSVTFGNISLDLSNYTASFSSIQYWMDLPYAFASPVRNQLGVSIYDGSIDCDARSAGFPDLEFTFQGPDGVTHTLAMTPDDYIRKEPVMSILDPSKCQVPIAMYHDRDESGEKVPEFVVLGNVFLRKFTSIFDADREIITLISQQ